MRFNKLFSEDLYDYENDYAVQGGLYFPFFWEAPTGRVNGHRCGSCYSGPYFRCSTEAYDSTCASRYCSIDGYCAASPRCDTGLYMDLSFRPTSASGVGSGGPAMRCVPCPAGRYGDTPGLIGAQCSGTCREGFYCPVGSTSPTQHPCGHAGVFCPPGSGSPIAASAGRRTVSDADNRVNNSSISGGILSGWNYSQYLFDNETALSTRVSDTLCDMGHYCVNVTDTHTHIYIYICNRHVYVYMHTL
jgi:hypothetical protein